MSTEQMKIGKVLVTGAAGFIGRAVVAELLRQGYRVRALVRDPQQQSLFPQAELAVADIAKSSDELVLALQGMDTVIHLAGVVWGGAAQMQRTMVDGTANLIGAMHQAGVSRLVLASSFSVYDWSRVAGVLNESSPLAEAESSQQGPYAQAKVRQEMIARQLCQQRGIRLIVLRPAAVVASDNFATADLGPRLGPLQVVIAPRRKLRLVGLVSAAAAFTEACSADIPHATTINLVDSRPVTAGQLAKSMQGSAVLLPLPYAGLLLAARLLYPIAKLVGMERLLPGLLVPARLACRFKSTAYNNAVWLRLLPESAALLETKD